MSGFVDPVTEAPDEPEPTMRCGSGLSAKCEEFAPADETDDWARYNGALCCGPCLRENMILAGEAGSR